MNAIKSILRGLPRALSLVVLGNILLTFASVFPAYLGSIGTPVAFGFGLCLLGLAAGDLALRILQPHVDTQQAAEEAIKGNVGAGLVYLGRCVLAAVVLMLMVTASRAETAPAAAQTLLPVLRAQQQEFWPSMGSPAALGAQVEQETCPSLSSHQCWNPRAELRTSREQGVGLGQLTRTFRTNGSTRFDAMQEIVAAYPKELDGLSWENRYDPRLQLRALVLKDKQSYDLIRDVAGDRERLAMTFAAYNGGLGGLNSDRKSCAGTSGCNPAIWFGNVEHTSLKAKTAVPGYGQSFFDVNREYVRNVMLVRIKRYEALGTT